MLPARRLRILICLLYYAPHRTGLTMYVRYLADELAKRGHQVTVVTARHDRALPRDEIMASGVRVVRLFATLRISRGMIMPAYPWAFWRLVRRHDVVSIHTPMAEAALVAWLSALAGRALVVTHHGDLVLPAGRTNRMITRVMRAIFDAAASRAAVIVGSSRDYAEHSAYLQPYGEKVLCKHPPVHVPPPCERKARAWREAWQKGRGPVIGFAHRFVEEKRPDLAMQALAVVCETHPDARLVFAGQHRIPYEPTWDRLQPLVRALGDRLLFVGPFDSREDMAAFYAACDVVVLTSDTECFGLATVESMLSGTPVVTTDVPGARVPVALTGMGRLAQRGDARDIGRALVEVLNNRTAYVRPRAVIEETFSLAASIDNYERLFFATVAGAAD